MADHSNGKDRRLRMPDTSTYEFGYRKPPQDTRFRPGQSGNPRGRPKESKRLPPKWNEEWIKAIVLDEVYRTISVRDGERTTIPMIQAIVRSLALTAAKGHQRSQRRFTELLQCVERDNKALHDAWLQTAIEYKVGWEEELERRERLGIRAPEPIPHPDDIVVDLRAGTVEITGPMTKEDKVVWEEWRQRKRECDKEIARLERCLRKDPDNRSFNEDIERERRIRAIFAQIIPD